MKKNVSSYTAKDIATLDAIEGIRKRPGMYIGGNDGDALNHCVQEVISNTVDEFLNGHGNEIVIEFHKDGSLSIEDNARGIPTDLTKDAMIGIESVVT